jgi:ABC-type glycerol-3-phosphate transport system substrate-binding protein
MGMRKLIAACAVFVALASACGGGDQAASTPTPAATSPVTGQIMGPAEKARDTVDQLNDLQNRTEQQTGGG